MEVRVKHYSQRLLLCSCFLWLFKKETEVSAWSISQADVWLLLGVWGDCVTVACDTNWEGRQKQAPGDVKRWTFHLFAAIEFELSVFGEGTKVFAVGSPAELLRLWWFTPVTVITAAQMEVGKGYSLKSGVIWASSVSLIFVLPEQTHHHQFAFQ